MRWDPGVHSLTGFQVVPVGAKFSLSSNVLWAPEKMLVKASHVASAAPSRPAARRLANLGSS